MKIIKKLIQGFILLGCIAVVILVILGYLRYKEVVKENPLDDAIGEIMNLENFIPYEDIDEDFLNAIVAIEDRRFYTRSGVDIISIGRSFLTNISSGEIKEGGSTITQQLAKNIYFSHAPSMTRKVAEVFLANELEAKYTKEEILAVYVNLIYYGDGYTGIHDASYGYFDKDPSDLTLYEATLLAGLPQSPSRYQLSNGYRLINKRQRNVVQAMLSQGLINEQQLQKVLELQPKVEE